MGFDEIENPVIVGGKRHLPASSAPKRWLSSTGSSTSAGSRGRTSGSHGRTARHAINGILKKQMPTTTKEKLRETLHAYKKSEIDGDELTHELGKGPRHR